MDPTVGAGLLLSAGVLGITHGIEPDHVAGITALTHDAGDPKLSALVGGCFAVGHALLVVLWIVIASVLFGATTFPPIFEQGGLLVVGVVLALLSLYLGIRGTRRFLHRHEHDHGSGEHAHVHVHLPASTHDQSRENNAHTHEHGVFEYLKIGTVGALFTLSPPVSMIAFISVVMSKQGEGLVALTVIAYTVSIVVTMAVIGGGAGSMFHVTKQRGEHYHAIFQIVAAVLVLAVALHLLIGVVPGLLA
jgi:nickel/cobalt exporter